ncbi:hypothetical protein EMCRGX_G013308 [Ephydatia muelleri]
MTNEGPAIDSRALAQDLTKESDLCYLVEDIWGGQSALSASDDPYELTLGKWDSKEQWSHWNCTLLTKDEVVGHNRLDDVHETAAPKRWYAFDGGVTEMDTPYTPRAQQLRDIYNTITLKGLSRDERLDVLLTLKFTVKLSMATGHCHSCYDMDNRARVRLDLTLYRGMLASIRKEEEAYGDSSRVTFLIQVTKEGTQKNTGQS